MLFVNRLVLIGASRSGKTTVGKELACQLSLPFFDSDQELLSSNILDKSVANLYQRVGELEFRRQESALVKELLKRSTGIFSLGGGTCLQKELLQTLKLSGPVLFLDVEQKTLLQRYLVDTPSFMIGLSDHLKIECIEKRRLACKIFSDATIFVSQEKSVKEVVKEIIEMYFGGFYGIK